MKISVRELNELLADKDNRIYDLTIRLHAEQENVKDLASQVLLLQEEIMECKNESHN